MKNIFLIVTATIVLALSIFAGIFYYQNLRGSWAAFQKAEDVSAPDKNTPEWSWATTSVKNNTGIPLALPSGSTIDTVATVPGARVIAVDKAGNLWISQTSEGEITEIEMQNGKMIKQTVMFNGLKNPHGLAFDPDEKNILYFAEEQQISKVNIASTDAPKKIVDLPTNGRHFTRTLGFGPDKRLYVAIGSSCDVCHETDIRRASIYSMNKDGSDFKQVASGLRNSVFFIWQNGQLWATEMGRDYLGDNLPPDEINIIENGKNYGWPNCYGQNIHDDKFDHNTYIRNPCMAPFETPSLYDLPAHSAPLGLAFIPKTGWPKNWQGDLLVAFHGSWNRTTPTGYKIVKLKIDYSGDQPKVIGIEDFISGWLGKNNTTYGRPVDIVTLPNGTMYISDDKAGKIYSVTF